METSKDFEEFFELLNKHKVRYLVVGGYAFAIRRFKRRYKPEDPNAIVRRGRRLISFAAATKRANCFIRIRTLKFLQQRRGGQRKARKRRLAIHAGTPDAE